MSFSQAISEFITPEAFAQWERLHKEAKQATQEMVDLTKAVTATTDAMGSAKTLMDVVTNSEKAADGLGKMKTAQANLSQTMSQFSAVVGINSKSLDSNIQQLVEATTEVKNLQEQMNRLKTKMEDGGVTQDKYYTRMGQLTEKMLAAKMSVNDYTTAINNEIKAVKLADEANAKLNAEIMASKLVLSEANAELKLQTQLQQAVPGSIAQARLQWQLYNKELINLAINSEDAAVKQAALIRQAELRSAMDERQTFIKSNVDNYTKQKINIGNYPDATAQLAQINAELKGMAEAGLQNTEIFAALTDKANEIRIAMGGVSGELTIITKQLQIMADEGLQDSAEFKAMTQRAIELKTAIAEVNNMLKGGVATNMGTGIQTVGQQLTEVKTKMQELALAGKVDSDEFKILALEAQRLSGAMNQVSTTIKGATTIGDKFTSIVERMGLRFIANMFIFQAAMKLVELITNLFTEGAEAAEKYNKSLKDIDNETYANYIGEQQKVQVLLTIAQDAGKAMNIRLEAVKKLQDEYPNYLGNLSKEAILTGNVTKEVEKLNDALYAKVMMEANVNKAKKAATKKSELEDEQKAVWDNYKLMEAQIQREGKNFPQSFAGETQAQYAESQLKPYKESIIRIGKEILAADKEVRDYLNKANRFGSDAAGVIVTPDKTKKKDTTKDDLNALYQARKASAEAAAALAKQEYQQDAEAQQAIFDNEEVSLQKRLEAYDKYVADKKALTRIDAGKELAELQAKQDELTAKEDAYKKGTLKMTKIAHEALVIEEETNALRIAAVKRDLHNKESAIDLVAAAKRLNITKTSNEVWIKAEETGLQERIQDFEDMYDKEKGLLDDSLKNKLITIEQYEDKLKTLRHSYDIINLNEQIAEYDYELKNENLTAQEKLSIETKLSNARKALRNSESSWDLQKAQEVKKAQDALTNEEWATLNKVMEMGKTIADSFYQSQLQYEQDLLTAIGDRKQAQLDAINTSLSSEKSKAEQVKSLNAQAALQEKQVQQEMKRIKREQAIADRAFAIIGIIANTAKAEAAALTNFSTPATAAYGAAIEAFIAAQGAIEIATILAQPIPYEKGTPNDSVGHPGGLALMGEGYKRELVIEPGKDPYFVDEPTVKDLPRFSRVIPEDRFIAAQMAFLTPRLLQSINVGGNDYRALQQSIDSSAARMESAVKRIQVQQFSMRKGEWTKSVIVGGSKTSFINRNIK